MPLCPCVPITHRSEAMATRSTLIVAFGILFLFRNRQGGLKRSDMGMRKDRNRCSLYAKSVGMHVCLCACACTIRNLQET